MSFQTSIPAFTYQIDPERCRNAQTQAVSSADRPLCAMASAFAALCNDRPLGGAGRMMSKADQFLTVRDWFAERDVPLDRLAGWVDAINHVPGYHVYPRTVGPFSLDPYQIETIDRTPLYGGSMALGCGLGKTVTAVALAQRALGAVATAKSRLWIVCPLNAMPAWERIKPHIRNFDDIQIISMDSLHKWAEATPALGGVLIFDEVHMLGEAGARRTKAAHILRPKFDAAFCLTGTMLHGGMEKALSIQDLAVPGLAAFATRWKAGEYFKCLVKVKLGARYVTELKQPVGLCKQAFMEYLAWGSVNMTKDSAIVRKTMQLPPQEIHTIELGDCSRPIDEIAANCALEILAETGELPHAQAVAHKLCAEGLDEKIAWLLGELDDPTQQVVVFAFYRESLDAVGEALAKAGIKFFRIDGDTCARDRTDFESGFQAGERQVFLGQIGAASVSMNLQNAQISVTIDHPWRAVDYDQSLARTCRRGQTRDCYHFDLIANKLQRIVVERLRAATEFNADAAEWQSLQFAVKMAHRHPAGNDAQ